ncbi:hypothetical protein BDFB_010749, partial [Asbolus verrucosus]
MEAFAVGTIVIYDLENCNFVHMLKMSPLLIKKASVIFETYVHSDLDSVYQHIPKNILPCDYGGNEKSMEELNKLFKREVMQYKSFFEHLDTLTVNESLRPEKLGNDDILSYYGNFRQLDFSAFRVHSDLDSLYDHINKDILPGNYGGNEKLEELDDEQ